MALNLSRTSILTVMISAMFCVAAVRITPSDPVSWDTPTQSDLNQLSYRRAAEKSVAAVLSDRLKGFPREEIPDLAGHFVRLCRHFRFDPAFVLALIQVESGFRVKAVSEKGAVGLMQIMPATGERVVQNLTAGGAPRIPSGRAPAFPGQLVAEQLMDPYVNLSVGMAYLSYLRDRYRNQTPYFLIAAYNLGPKKLNELLSRESFKPVKTKKYYDDIRRAVPEFRFYHRSPLVHADPGAWPRELPAAPNGHSKAQVPPRGLNDV